MKRKHFNIILVIAFIIIIIPFLIISIYSRPSADDFVYSSDTYHLIQSGNWNILDLAKQAFETDIYYYNNWQGLYTSAFVLALQPGIFGEKLYFLGSIFLFILIYFCLYFGLKNINCVLKLRFNLWFAALFLLSFFVIGIPDMLQGFYWFNGAWNYIPFFFLTFLNVSILFRYIFDEGNHGWLIVVSSVLSFLISGGNHVTGFLNILCLFFLLIVAFMRKRRKMSISFIVAVVGYIIMFVAPGTAIRAAAFPHHPSIVKTVIRSGIECCRLIIEWTDLKWTCMFLLCLPVAIKIKKKHKFSCKINPILMLCVVLTIFCGCLCVPYYAMGGFGDARVTNIFWIIYFLLSILTMEYVSLWLFERWISIQQLKLSIKRWQLQLVILILLGGVYFGSDLRNNNFLVASWELYNGSAKNFAVLYDERVHMIKESKDVMTIVVKPLPESKCLRLGDISQDSTNWVNKTWEQYYGKSIVVVKPSDE